ncbi:GntR family transcriptional regulator [Nonomuraea sp. NPDC050790]|uniref:GntR family transcriptional regulator n=1 Tax=Nonomuraea sp. NPDC050790 TaxID=3364371 RepID=UPI0037ACA9B1
MNTDAFESKAQFIARAIRSRILNGTLADGQSLRQRDIAADFDVSATPVREAFRQLEAEGYIVSKLHHGVVVRPLGARMEENWRLREALEAIAAEKAAENATAHDVERLRALATEFDAAEEDAAEKNRALHFAIYRLADSPVLLRFLNELWQTLDVNPSSLRSHKASSRDHWDIVEAIARGDAEAAADLTRAHVKGTAPK